MLKSLGFESMPLIVWIVLGLGFLGAFMMAQKGDKVVARHILVVDGGACTELKQKILEAGGANQQGLMFEQLAKKHSKCPSGKDGGLLGKFGRGQMVPEFDKVCWEAPLGEVQGPVKTQFGYHLILVTEREIKGEKKD